MGRIRSDIILIFGYIKFLVIMPIKFDIRQVRVIRQGIGPGVSRISGRTFNRPLHLLRILHEDNRIRSYCTRESYVSIRFVRLLCKICATYTGIHISAQIELAEYTCTRNHRRLRRNGISTHCAVLRRYCDHAVDEGNGLEIRFLLKSDKW